MRRISLITAALVLLPLVAHAETFTTVRDIIIPVSRDKAENIVVELEPQIGIEIENTSRMVNSDNNAVPFTIIHNDEDVMPIATIVSSPKAADTIPATTVDMVRDGDRNTVFQPVADSTFRTFTFLLKFSEDVTPSHLEYVMESGRVQSVHVRLGMSSSTLHDAFFGAPSGSSIWLSGERARVVEITMEMLEGVPRIRTLQLFQPHSRLIFKAERGELYRLLSGIKDSSFVNPSDSSLTDWQAIPATLGPVRAASATDNGDHDLTLTGDNCPDDWNYDQQDMDKDGVGDVCDNCVAYANPLQEDANNNANGDACDDDDNDGVVNALDNCSQVSNRYQEDEDKDGQGNLCDNVDNRFTAGKPWLLWSSLVLVILMLGGAGVMVLSRTEKGDRGSE